MLMRVRHAEQRPRRASQLTSGMFSQARMRWPHDGQAERGRTTDLPRGTRWMATLAKLPNTLPSTATSASAGTRYG
jgi:hypothetical protein